MLVIFPLNRAATEGQLSEATEGMVTWDDSTGNVIHGVTLDSGKVTANTVTASNGLNVGAMTNGMPAFQVKTNGQFHAVGGKFAVNEYGGFGAVQGEDGTYKFHVGEDGDIKALNGGFLVNNEMALSSIRMCLKYRLAAMLLPTAVRLAKSSFKNGTITGLTESDETDAAATVGQLNTAMDNVLKTDGYGNITVNNIKANQGITANSFSCREVDK